MVDRDVSMEFGVLCCLMTPGFRRTFGVKYDSYTCMKLFITSITITRKFTRRASKRQCVLFAAVWREPGVIIRHVLYAAGWREPCVVCYHI